MKVVICGAQSVGKTTLINSLPDKYKDKIVTGVLRKILISTPGDMTHSEDADAYTQTKFFDTLWNELVKRKDYISDRGLVDVVAYSKYLGESRKLGIGIYQIQMRELKEWASKHKDEVYVYIPIEFEIIDDGLRSLDKEFQSGIDRSIREVLDDSGIKYIVIKGSNEKRLADFVKALSDIEKGKKLKNDNVLEKLPPKKYPKTEKSTTKIADTKQPTKDGIIFEGKKFKIKK